jgi:UDP-glucose 4-epimerase
VRVVVTGGAGFIGSHVADAFLGRGDDVLVIDDLSSGKREHVPANAELAELDISDGTALHERLEGFGTELICHLAAQSSVTVSVSNPDLDFASNVRGTFNVCQTAAAVGARVVFASTGGALYGSDVEMIPTPESAIPKPLAPYGASKLAGEAFVATQSRSDGLPHVVLRLGNVYGPRQSPHGEAGVVAIFSDRLIRGESPVAFGHGKPTRDYVHVADVVRAFTAAADNDVAGTFNVGWGRETTVLALLEVVQKAAGTSIEPRLEPLRPGELGRSALDSRRAAEILGWRPELAFDRGIAETFDWYASQQAS